MTLPPGISNNNPTKYLGPDANIVSIVSRNRQPTGADIRQGTTGQYYPLGSLWIISKNPTTGSQGDMYWLSSIISNVANWQQIGTALADTNTITVDAFTSPGTNPVLPDGSGNITITGGQVAAGTVGAHVIRTDSLAANAFTIEIQRSASAASTDSTKNGVSHFDSSSFGIDGNGFVTLNTVTVPKGGTGLTTLTSNAILFGNGTSAVSLAAPTNNGVLVSNNTGVPSMLANSGTPGFVLTANSGAPPSWQSNSAASIAAFFAVLSVSDTTATGGGTLYLLGSGHVLTIIAQNGSGLATNGIFTAPIAGMYHFSAAIYVSGITSAMTTGSFYFLINNANVAYGQIISPFAVSDAAGVAVVNISSEFFLGAAGTVQVACQISGATDVATIVGGGVGSSTQFSGFLVG